MENKEEGELIYLYQVYLQKDGKLLFKYEFNHEIPKNNKFLSSQTMLIVSACLDGLGEAVKKFSALFSQVFEDDLKIKINKVKHENLI